MPSDRFDMGLIDAALAWFREHQSLLGWAGLFSLVAFVVSLVSVLLILIYLPQNYFVYMPDDRSRGVFSDHPAVRIVYVVLKNLLGAIFLLAGLVMLVLPGQGIISILIGLSFLSLPGKRRLVRRIIRTPSVLRSINGLRRKAGKPPLQVPE